MSRRIGTITRAWALRLHRWVGLALGGVLLVSGGSGLLLLSGDWLERGIEPGLFAPAPGARASIDSVVEALRRTHPDLPLVRLRLPRDEGDVYEAWLQHDGGPRAYVDPVTAEVRGTRSKAGTVKGSVFVLHTELLSGSLGHVLVGIGALSLLFLTLSGLVLWWPGVAHLRRGFTLRRGRRLADAHSIGGLITAPVLVLIAVTATSLVFPARFQILLDTVTPGGPRAGAPPWHGGGSAQPGNVAALLASAEAALPGGHVSWLYFPPASGGWFVVRKRLPGERHPNGKSFAYIDATTGVVNRAVDARQNGISARFFDSLYPAHIGRTLGVAPHAIAAIALVALVITGWTVWWQRRAARRGRRNVSAPVRRTAP